MQYHLITLVDVFGILIIAEHSSAKTPYLHLQQMKNVKLFMNYVLHQDMDALIKNINALISIVWLNA